MVKRIISLVILSLCLIAQDKDGNISISKLTINSAQTYTSYLQMTDASGKIVFKVSPQGEITFGEGVKISDAAKQFADYLKLYMPCDDKPKKIL